MKRFIPILPLAFLFTACTSNPEANETKTLQSTQQNAASVDTTGLAEFQAWKAQNELAAVTPVQQVQQPGEPVKTVTVIREVRVQQPAPVERKTVRQQPPAPVAQSPEPAPQPSQPEPAPSAGNEDVAANTGSGSAGEGSQPQEGAKEGGWNKSKKGAVIGAAGGAVIGAVINKKNRAVGAVIGGVLGGAAGYGLGKNKDNKAAGQ